MVTLRDQVGKAVETFPFSRGDAQFDLVRDLFELARDNASGVEKMIDSIIAEVAGRSEPSPAS